MFLPSIFLLFCFPKLALCISKHPLILIVSFDAFGQNFLSEKCTPFLYSLAQQGTHVKKMRNVFPTKTLTNHMTIGSGVFPEDHGVLANKIIFKGKRIANQPRLFHGNKNITPIWTLNQIQGKSRHSGSMMWPGANFKYKGVRPTHWQKYNSHSDWYTHIDTMISWFLNDKKPANLVMAYYWNLDKVGHKLGVNHKEFTYQLQQCDKTAQVLMEKIEAHNLTDRINVFFVSDHGMISVRKDHTIDLPSLAGQDLHQFDIEGTSPVFQINTRNSVGADKKDELVQKMYMTLKKKAEGNKTFEIYRKEDIPDAYHYKHNHRVAELLAVAKPGYAFQDLFRTNPKAADDDEKGVHGYFHDEEPRMLPLFIATGPNIRQKYEINHPVDTVDLYPLVANLLRLKLPRQTRKYRLRGKLENVVSMIVNNQPMRPSEKRSSTDKLCEHRVLSHQSGSLVYSAKNKCMLDILRKGDVPTKIEDADPSDASVNVPLVRNGVTLYEKNPCKDFVEGEVSQMNLKRERDCEAVVKRLKNFMKQNSVPKCQEPREGRCFQFRARSGRCYVLVNSKQPRKNPSYQLINNCYAE